MEDPKVMCQTPCSFNQDTSTVFLEANRKHRTWFRGGNISGVYNSETIGITYDCDWKRNSFKCAQDHGVWVLRTTIVQNKDKASINVMLFDESAAMIGQGSISREKKVKIIEKQKTIQQQMPAQTMTATNCPDGTNTCTTIPVTQQGQTTNQIEDLEPTVIEIAPILLDRDVGQAMIHMYDSILVK